LHMQRLPPQPLYSHVCVLSVCVCVCGFPVRVSHYTGPDLDWGSFGALRSSASEPI